VDERERVLVTLAGMRALMGAVWLSLLVGKLPPHFGRHDRDGLRHTFEVARQHAVTGPLRGLVHRLVIPHFTLFAWIVFLLELTAGLLLVTGFYTRAGAWLGLGLALVTVVFLGNAPHNWRFALVLLVAWHVVLLATPCARRLSLDDRLGRDP
jgi:thiosulfate dehydrogenase [quinone] large subunit